MEKEATGPAPMVPDAPNVGAKLLRVAWLGVLLGVAMEALLLFFAVGFGRVPGFGAFAADFVGGVSWSLLVCVGLAVGTTVAKGRLPLAGVIGFVAAPASFEISRDIYEGMVGAVSGVGGGYPFAIAAVKGVEYGFLAIAIGWVASRPWGGAAAHAAVGLVAGLLFGGVIIAVSAGAVPRPPTAELFSTGINEILFPVGCAMVLFSVGALGRKLGLE